MEKTRILIIDDDPLMQNLIRAVLEKSGYEVLKAANGLDGLETIKGERPELVISDVMMPKMDGFELVQKVRSNPFIARTPLIMLSAKSEERDKVKGLELGADDYMTKPFGRKELVAKVGALIRRNQMLQQRTAPSSNGPFEDEGLEQLADYRFDNFVVGTGNRSAYEAAKAATENPGRRFNPLFLYGGPGLGKTHLMCALANEIYEKNNKVTALYLTSEIFSQQILDAYQRREVTLLRSKYTDSDVLVIDDIQFLAISPSLQVVAADILSEMYDQGKQIVISSDKRPEELSTIVDEISTGFAFGLVVEVDRPDSSLRSRILRFKAEQRDWPLDGELIDYLANELDSDIRTLEGVARRLVAMSALGGVLPTKEKIDELVKVVTETGSDEYPPYEVSAPRQFIIDPQSDEPEQRPKFPSFEDVLAEEFSKGVVFVRSAGVPEDVAATVPKSATKSVVVLGTSSALVIDTLEALAGAEEFATGLPQGSRWAHLIHVDNNDPKWVLTGMSDWNQEDDLACLLYENQPPAFLVVLDSMSPSIMDARALLASLPERKEIAVVILASIVDDESTEETREALSRSMRRLFRVSGDVPVIVDGRVGHLESRRWLSLAVCH